MQAVFRFNGSEELVVSNAAPSGVLVEHIISRPASEEDREEWKRFCSVAASPDSPGVPFNAQAGHVDGGGFYRRTLSLLQLSKSQARAVASAIMGAAAEL